MKKMSNARVRKHDPLIPQAWTCEILIGQRLYRTQEDILAVDLWRNRFRGRGDGAEGAEIEALVGAETEVSTEKRWVSPGKARCFWPCGAYSSSLGL